MNVEIGAEAVLFPEKEYLKGIFVAVWCNKVPRVAIVAKYPDFKYNRLAKYLKCPSTWIGHIPGVAK
jgi:hypothetical protein